MSWSRLSENVKKLDIFSQEMEILFEDNKAKLQTHCGVVVSFVMFALLLVFGV